MPKFPGKKPSQRKASKKTSTKRVREFLNDADDAKRVSRIKVTETACDAVHQSGSSSLPEDFTASPSNVSESFESFSPGDSSKNVEVPVDVPIPQGGQSFTLADTPLHSTATSTLVNTTLHSTASYSTSAESSMLWPSLPPPPPLVRAPIPPHTLQVAMPVMYAPTYWAGGHGSVQPVAVQQGSLQPLQQLAPMPPALSGEDQFYLRGNISRCTGCGSRDLRNTEGKPHAPPEDLCLQHKEHVTFENPRTGTKQLSHDLRNVYYHARHRCILKCTPHPQVAMSGETVNCPYQLHYF